MTRPPRLIDCTFCGAQQVERAREDVFPKWLTTKLAVVAKAFHPDLPPTYVHYDYDTLDAFRDDARSGERATARTRTGAVATPRILNDVCGTCNGGWLSRMEAAARLLLSGIMNGKAKLLDPFDQFILATWVTKTALTYDAACPVRLIPAEQGTRVLYGWGYAPPATTVWIGYDYRHVPMGELLFGRRPLKFDHSLLPFTYLNAVQFTFQFDRVLAGAVLNYGQDFGRFPERIISLAYPANFQRIWPPQGRLLWPPEAP